MEDISTVDELEVDDSRYEAMVETLVMESAHTEMQVRVLENAFMVLEDFEHKKISEEQLRYTVYAMESVAYADWTPQHRLVVANENLLTRMFKGIQSLLESIHLATIKVLDAIQYSAHLFSLQKSRIDGIRNQLRQISIKEAPIKVGINKYMVYGEHNEQVESIETYLKQYELLTDSLVPYMEALGSLAEDDLFKIFSFYKEAVFGDPDEFFEDRFFSLERHLHQAVQGVKAHQVRSTSYLAEYKTAPLLGMATLMVRLPKPNSYNRKDYNTLVAAHRYFYMTVERKLKFRLSTLASGNATMTVKAPQVETLLKHSERILKAAEGLNKATVWLSKFGATQSNNFFMDRQERPEGSSIPLFNVTKIYARCSSIIYEGVATSYLFAIGNIKHANTIAEKADKRMS